MTDKEWRQLVDYYANYGRAPLLLPTVPAAFDEMLAGMAKTMERRRMVNMNLMIFRSANMAFADSRAEVKDYVKNLVDFYKSFWLKRYGIV